MWEKILKMPSWNIDFKSLPADTKLSLTMNSEIDMYELPQVNHSFKPKGLWYSFAGKDNWTNWLKNWGSSEWDLNYDHVIMFETSGNILKINNEQDAKDFIDKYQKFDNNMWWVDWHKVAQDYDGIEFHNQWQYRDLEYGGSNEGYSQPSTFLYGLDIDSGCLWNTTTITNQRVYAERFDKNPSRKRRVKIAYDEASEEGEWSPSDERLEEIAGTDDWKIVLRD